MPDGPGPGWAADTSVRAAGCPIGDLAAATAEVAAAYPQAVCVRNEVGNLLVFDGPRPGGLVVGFLDLTFGRYTPF